MAIRLVTSTNPLFKLVVCSQWCLLALTIVLQTLSLVFIQPGRGPTQIEFSLLMLALLSATSIYLPEHKPYWFKVLFVCFELLVVSTTLAVGTPRWVWPLYLVLIARASLLLKRRDVWLVVAMSCVSQVVLYVVKLSISGELQAPANVIASMVLTSSYAALMIVVAWWMQTLISEQDLRRKSESLALQNQVLAADLERNRIARELHDSLGHSLTALKIQLELASKMFDRDLDRARDAVEQAQELAARSLTETRATLHSIRQGDFDFEEAVGQLVHNIEANGSVSVSCELSNAAGISNTISYQLYRVVQECMTNTLKHAQATRIIVTLRHESGVLYLAVQDNGVGFDQVEAADGFGLKGIKERIASLSGTVDVKSKLQEGTTISVKVPQPIGYNYRLNAL